MSLPSDAPVNQAVRCLSSTIESDIFLANPKDASRSPTDNTLRRQRKKYFSSPPLRLIVECESSRRRSQIEEEFMRLSQTYPRATMHSGPHVEQKWF
jgi:hypothetical protein